MTIPTADPRPAADQYRVFVTTEPAWIQAAQRLRHDVFSAEYGAEFPSAVAGSDGDRFDVFCDHLVIWHEASETVAGTCRMLRPPQARAAGGQLSEHEFDLSSHAEIQSTQLEVGRLCVHPDHRNGAVVSQLWSGIVGHAERSGCRWLGGCCSIPLADGGAQAAAVWKTVEQGHLAPEHLRLRPHTPWLAVADQATGSPAHAAATPTTAPPRQILPPLLRGYLRLGADVCGEPAYDPDFHCADLYVLLDLDKADRRYLSRYASYRVAP